MTATVSAPAQPVAAIESKSPRQLAWARFTSDRKTVVAGWLVISFTLLALSGPLLVSLGVLDPYTVNQDLIGVDSLPLGGWGGISWQHPLGVEPGTGRDTLSRIWLGLSYSLMIASLASLLAVLIGVVLGIVAGMSGGWADTIVGRTIDLVLSFPQTLMLLALSGTIVVFLTGTLQVPEGNTAQSVYVILVLAVFGWPPVARLVRGQVLSLREREFIDAARLFGASKSRLWFSEVLPNLWALILVQFTLILPAYVSAEAALSFLGISVLPPTPTVGNVMADSLRYASSDFLYFIAPAALLVTIVVSFNLLGDGLRDALDPKTGRS